MNLKELFENKGKIVSEIRSMADVVEKESRDFTAEEKTKWDKINADYKALESRIEIQKKADEMSKAIHFEASKEKNSEDITDETRSLACCGWAKPSKLRNAHEGDAAEKCGVNLNSNEIDFRMSPVARGGNISSLVSGGGVD